MVAVLLYFAAIYAGPGIGIYESVSRRRVRPRCPLASRSWGDAVSKAFPRTAPVRFLSEDESFVVASSSACVTRAESAPCVTDLPHPAGVGYRMNQGDDSQGPRPVCDPPESQADGVNAPAAAVEFAGRETPFGSAPWADSTLSR